MATSAGTVIANFAGIEGDGTFRAVPRDARPRGDAGFVLLGTSFDLDADGFTFQKVEVCLPYDEANQPTGVEETELRLYHFDQGRQVDITTRVDVSANRVCGTTNHLSPFAVGYEQVTRLAGPGRVETAAAISAGTFEPGVAVAFIATATGFPDALVAGAASGTVGGPVLLVHQDSLPDATATELERLSPARIVVVGGPVAVSDNVVTALAPFAQRPVERLSGDNRFGTAAAISAAFFEPGVDVVHVATGLKFPDALTGGAAASVGGGPVILVTPTSIPAEMAAELARLDPTRIVVIGGTVAVTDDVITALGTIVDAPIERVAGETRYATGAAVSATFADTGRTVYIATGANFPDALAGVPAAATSHSPVLLVPGTSVPDEVAAELARIAPHRIVILGGEVAIDEATRNALAAFVSTPE